MRSHVEPPTIRDLRRLEIAGRELTSTRSPQDVAETAVRHAAALIDSDRVVLLLADSEGALEIGAVTGVGTHTLERFRRLLRHGLVRCMRVLLGGRPDECFIAVPLVANGSVIGALAAVRREDTAFSDREERALAILADQAAIALQNARLRDGRTRTRAAPRVRAVNVPSRSPIDDETVLQRLEHDLRSPLNTIETCSGLLEMQLVGALNERQRELIERIGLSSRHILSLVEQTLEMVRLSGDEIEIRLEAVSLRRIAGESVSIVRGDAEANALDVVVELPDDLHVRADPGRLRQALLNLLGNAVKYTPRGGRVRLTATRHEDDAGTWVLVRVTDTGPGVPEDVRDVVFEPYRRGDTEAAGTGLGLWIAREAVRRMGGDIAIERTGPRGTTFLVRLRPAGPP